MTVSLNALNPVADINNIVQLANSTKNLIRPEVFYSKQLLDTIRMNSDQYVYYRLADVSPIQDKAEKLTVRRWAPLQAHTVPLEEGIPPKSDKGSVEKYEMQAYQYGRYMEFTDKVDFAVVDPVVAHYASEYSIVAVETLDMLARETAFALAQKYYAGMGRTITGTNLFENLTVGSKPNMTDLRLIVLNLKRQLVKPRKSGKYLVVCSPEFTYDMISDATVEKFMTINQTTKNLYDGTVLFPMFGMEFMETLVCPSEGTFKKVLSGDTEATTCKRIYRVSTQGETSSTQHGTTVVAYDSNTSYTYTTISVNSYKDAQAGSGEKVYKEVSGYVKDSRTNQDASYIPNQGIWDIANYKHSDGTTGWSEMNVHHILIVGKDALTRTGLEGEGNAKMYTKAKGSAGVLDPIDQRQSIGFKINSVGFASTRLEALVDYHCVPSTANLV